MTEKKQNANNRQLDKEVMRRLLIIHNIIKEGGDSRPESLASLCNVEKITIYRDIATLKKDRKAPIEFDRTKKRYYYSDPDYELEKNPVTPEEFLAIAKTKLLLAKLGNNTELYREFSKVLDYITDTHMIGNSRLRFYEIEPPREKTVNTELWKTVLTAISENRIMKIKRRNLTDWPETIVHPYQLIFDEGSFYLWGKEHWQDKSDKESNLFINLNKIEQAVLCPETFSLPEDYSYENRPKITYKLRLFNDARNICISFAENQETVSEDNKEDSVTVSFQTSKKEQYVLKWILAQGADIVPVEPQYLVEAWQMRISNLLKRSNIHEDWILTHPDEAKEILENRDDLLRLRMDKEKFDFLQTSEKDSKKQIYDYLAKLVRIQKRLDFEYIKNMNPEVMMNYINELIPSIPCVEIILLAQNEKILNQERKTDILNASEIINFIKSEY